MAPSSAAPLAPSAWHGAGGAPERDALLLGRRAALVARALVVVAGLEVLVAVSFGVAAVSAFAHGSRDWPHVVAVAALGTLVVCGILVVRLARTVRPLSSLRAVLLYDEGRLAYDASAKASARVRQRVTRLMERAELQVALQPITDVTRGTFAGAEALARFPDDRRPDLWFAEAHRVGLGTDLELLALRVALDTVDHLPPSAFLSVNASPALILDERFTALLTATPCPTVERLVVEITEHEAVGSYDDIVRALQPLRERGLRLAVDDTGAGYASFSHVLRLRPDTIKLDRSIVAKITTDAAARALVTAVVLLALEMNATVTGEGLETVEELRTAVDLGIDHAQGYVLGCPTTDVTVWHGWRGSSGESVSGARPGGRHVVDLAVPGQAATEPRLPGTPR